MFNHLGFQGFRVHDGGEKDLTLLPTITGKRGRGKNGERAKEKEREGIGHYRSLWKPQSLTPSDTPHPFQTISPAGYQAFKCVSLDWRDGSAVKGWVDKQIHEPLGAVLIQHHPSDLSNIISSLLTISQLTNTAHWPLEQKAEL